MGGREPVGPVATSGIPIEFLCNCIESIKSQKQRPGLGRLLRMVKSHYAWLTAEDIKKGLDSAVDRGLLLVVTSNKMECYKDPEDLRNLRRFIIDGKSTLWRAVKAAVREMGNPIGSTEEDVLKYVKHCFKWDPKIDANAIEEHVKLGLKELVEDNQLKLDNDSGRYSTIIGSRLPDAPRGKRRIAELFHNNQIDSVDSTIENAENSRQVGAGKRKNRKPKRRSQRVDSTSEEEEYAQDETDSGEKNSLRGTSNSSEEKTREESSTTSGNLSDSRAGSGSSDFSSVNFLDDSDSFSGSIPLSAGFIASRDEEPLVFGVEKLRITSRNSQDEDSGTSTGERLSYEGDQEPQIALGYTCDCCGIFHETKTEFVDHLESEGHRMKTNGRMVHCNNKNRTCSFRTRDYRKMVAHLIKHDFHNLRCLLNFK